MKIIFLAKCGADFAADSLDGAEIQFPVALAWSAHANQRDFRFENCVNRIRGGVQPARFASRSDQFFEARFHNGAVA